MITIRKATKDEFRPRDKSLYLVERDGKIVGTIIKPHNTKTDIFPWNVYRFGDVIAMARFYDYADSVKIGSTFDYEKDQTGGKSAAFVFARKMAQNA